MTSATVTAAAARTQALRRVQARIRPATHHTKTVAGQAIDVQDDGTGPGTGFKPPASLDEWIDDRLAHLPAHGAATELITMVLEAARPGPDAAAAAVRHAQRFAPWDQYLAHEMLRLMPAQLQEADTVRRAVLRQWDRLGLPVRPPSTPFGREPYDLNSPRPTVKEYPTPLGFPA
jgi:hypothetical protein